MEKKRVNLYLSEVVKQELDLQAKKYGMSYGNYVAYLVLLRKVFEEELEKENEK